MMATRKPARRRDFLTTGEVAKLLGVAAMTVINYCKRGELVAEQSKLTGYRRIPRQAVIDFMKKRSLPTDQLEASDPAPSCRVLIADDEEDVRWSIAEAVRQLMPHATIAEAADGYAACLQAGSFSPDLITLDLQMPQMNGFEVCSAFRASPATKHSKILVVTGFSTRQNLEEIHRRGADDFLAKPFKVADLKDKITALLGAAVKVAAQS